MYYICGDDTSLDNQKFYVSFVIDDGGKKYVDDCINKLAEDIGEEISTFKRIHMRDLCQQFNCDRQPIVVINESPIKNSKDGVYDGVASVFVDMIKTLIDKGCLIPVFYVTSLDSQNVSVYLDNTLLSTLTKIKNKELLGAIYNVKMICEDYEIEKEPYTVWVDRLDNKEKTIPINSFPYLGSFSVHSIDATREPLLQLADFIAYSYKEINAPNHRLAYDQLKKYYKLV